MSRTFAAFQIRNYRFFFFGALISNIGTWIQRIAQDWLVLTELTDNSATELGIITALQFLAIPFLAGYAGSVIDRYSKRKLLFCTQFALALIGFAMWAVVFFGIVEMWQMYLLAFLQGIVAAFDNPGRQSFVPEMVPQTLLPNAVGLNAMSFNGARLIGPGVAGVLVAAVGTAPALLINAVTFIAMLIALYAMDSSRLHPAPRVAKKGATRGGIAYIKSKPDIIVLLIIVFTLGTFGLNFQIYNATMATEVYGKGATEFGMLGTVMALGTFAGAFAAARRTHPRLKTILASLFAFSLATILAAFAPNYYLYAVLLIPAGFFSLSVMTSANVATQLASAPSFRGRVMAIYMAIFIGGTPLGAPIIGWVGDVFGPRATLILGGVTNLLCAVGMLLFFMLHDGLRLRIEYRHHLPNLIAVWPNHGTNEVNHQ